MKKYKGGLIFDFVVIVIILLLAIFLVTFGQLQWREVTIFLICIYLMNLFFVLYLLFKDDNNQEKIVWMFFLIIIPIISHIIFALFRIRRPNSIDRVKYEKELEEFSSGPRELDPTKHSFESKFEKQQFLLTKRFFYPADIKMYIHGFDAYEELFKDLEKAKKYIHMEMYIIKPSEIFEQFKDLLIKKAQEGVEIKIIVDDFGSWLIKSKEFDFMRENGIEIANFNKTFYPFVKPSDNNRLHRKFFVIDGEIVHSGGLNISDEYNSYNAYYGYWADLSFKINKNIVNDYEILFMYDWYKLTKEKLPKHKYLIQHQEEEKNNSRVLLFDAWPQDSDNVLESALVDWIMGAKEHIRLATPYFVPSEIIFKALKFALKKGIRIDIYIPGKPDKKLVYRATNYYLTELVKMGANVYKIKNVFLHSKLAVFDNEFAYIGTNNFDMRSIFTNFEAVNVVQGKQPIAKMNELFDEYQDFSEKIEAKLIEKKSFKFKKIFYEFFAPLM